MNIVLLRVGIDTRFGGIHSPLFADGTFEFVSIPDDRNLDERTYGNSKGRHGRALKEYFPREQQIVAASQSMHVDPEFSTFTYGDPTRLKSGLAKLKPGDLLVFYAGMEGWGHTATPALYLVGFFKVKFAGFAHQLSESQLIECSGNFHVRHRNLFCEQQKGLVLVKGDSQSRLFQKAYKLGERVKRDVVLIGN